MTKYTPETIEQLKQNLISVMGEETLKAEMRKIMGPPWPKEYVNRDTGKVYTPHNDDERRFVYSDEPRYALCKGGEGCLSANTEINGIPIPEWQPSQINTAFGPSPSTESYLKGRADLYRVQTGLGEDVEVTADHRFLTPIGWRPLRDLSSGDLIAGYDTQSESIYSGTDTSSPSRGSAGSHPGGELPTPMEVLALDKLSQLSSTGTCYPDMSPLDHPCTRYSSSLAEQTRLLIGFLLRDLPSADVFFHLEGQYCDQFPHKSPHLDSVLPIHPLEDHICWGDCVEYEYQTSSTRFAEHTLLSHQAHLQPSLYPGISPIALAQCRSCKSFDHAPRDRCGLRSVAARQIHMTESNQVLSLPFSECQASDTPQRFPDLSSLYYYLLYGSPSDYTITWTEIQAISFVGEGDFYDLHVPFWNHYSAHGLLHHNSGKSVAGIVKCLNRVQRKMSGIMVSPTLPHFKVSLFKEFRRWCPWDQVVEKHQGRAREEWEPFGPFTLVFRNGAFIECRGIDNEGSCEGPNVNWVFFDEARHKSTPLALKVLDGRVRVPGPGGISPQTWITSTPRKHWMFDYFSGLKCICHNCGDTGPVSIQEGKPFQCTNCESPDLTVVDEYESFKRDSLVITLSTKDNEGNIQDGFAQKRAQTLTEAEARVLLDAEWEDIDEGQPFLPHISWWDDCREDLPPLGSSEPLILAVDAATGRASGESDCFAIVGVTRHPTRPDSVAIRYVKTWQAPSGGKIDYIGDALNPGPERELLRLCGWAIKDEKYIRLKQKPHNVKCIVFDPNELHDLGMRFSRKRVAWMYEFGQLNMRIKADTDFLRIIQEKRIAHDGNATLRQHIYNADRKGADGKKLRMVKRSDTRKIDAAVSASMGTFQCLYLQLGKK